MKYMKPRPTNSLMECIHINKLEQTAIRINDRKNKSLASRWHEIKTKEEIKRMFLKPSVNYCK